MILVAAIEALVIVLLLLPYRFREYPHISLRSPCPACGYRGLLWPGRYACKLSFDVNFENVKRTCLACGCQIVQPPVYPALFQAKTSAKK